MYKSNIKLRFWLIMKRNTIENIENITEYHNII